MKYLLVFYFAGFFLADAVVQIKKYKLSLDPKEGKFEGKVTLTLSGRPSRDDVELSTYDYTVKKCTYTGIDPPTTLPPTTLPPTTLPTTTLPPPTLPTTTLPTTTLPTTTRPPKTLSVDSPGSNVRNCSLKDKKIIKFPSDRIGEDVVLEFEGGYEKNGLSKYPTAPGVGFYVADMAAKDHKLIFPCRKGEKAQFEFDGDGVVMSNLENLRKKGDNQKISLGDLAFVLGDIVKDESSTDSLQYYRMKNSERVGQKLKKVMDNVAQLHPDLKILFTPFSEEIPIISRDVIILSNVDLKSDDSNSDYKDMALKLARKWFQRSEEEKKTFFDKVGPEFVATKISAADYPSGRIFSKFQALEKDGFNNAKSLNELVSNNQNSWLNEVFYPKGIYVLYALESVCGDEKFKEGLSNYVRNGNSKVEEAFEKCFGSKEEAKEFFKVWGDNPGYPVVHVILDKAAQYGMDQERFLWIESEEKDQRWVIPIDYKVKEGSGGNISLPATKKNVTVTINSTYFILDHNDKGFYRVNYDAKSWEALMSQLKSNHSAIDLVSRMKLIDDVFSFPRSTHKFNHDVPNYVTALKLSEYLRNETDSWALAVAFDRLGFLDSALNSSYHGKFRDHMKGILNGIYHKIKEVKDPQLQDQVFLLACRFGVEECITEATKIFREIKSNANKLTEQQKLAICSVVRNDSTKWMDSFALLKAMDMKPIVQTAILGCSRDETILSLLLTQFITPEGKEELINAVNYAMEHNPDNIKVILNIIKRFKDAITNRCGKKYLQDIVRLALPKLNPESAGTIKEIAKGLDEDLNKEVNLVCDNVGRWTNKNAKSVGEYFVKGSGSQAKPIALLLLVTTLLPLANHIFHS